MAAQARGTLCGSYGGYGGYGAMVGVHGAHGGWSVVGNVTPKRRVVVLMCGTCGERAGWRGPKARAQNSIWRRSPEGLTVLTGWNCAMQAGLGMSWLGGTRLWWVILVHECCRLTG